MPLVTPNPQHQATFLAALGEYHADGLHLDLDATHLARTTNFAAYLDKLAADANPNTPRPAHRVPQTTYWYIDRNRYLGRVSIRHWLTTTVWPHGHIGYDVIPSARRRGHATRMLAQALPHARELGIHRALLTCHPHNHASRAVIERNGGQLRRHTHDRLYYHIDTGDLPPRHQPIPQRDNLIKVGVCDVCGWDIYRQNGCDGPAVHKSGVRHTHRTPWKIVPTR